MRGNALPKLVRSQIGAPRLQLEDALGLWLVALRNVPGPCISPPSLPPGTTAQQAAQQLQAQQPLLTLLPLLATAMASSTEHIALGCTCTAAAVVLGGGLLVAAYGAVG